ncbi:PTS cellobiose transporter subunit IIA [Lactobacillus bombicola]|uniref:PTS cellobiose transporter subunit IIA n=1 Tax=Lactobacillus bombicola TaxID=1505723 RepID=A0ABX9LWW8_9LACO|nr:PTS cellobiose transporter subunit IIA [Lactobacillus bombicola]RHW53637.1 PTS cellobiose transporter subunit IIA [Lactobacillus bombicola]
MINKKENQADYQRKNHEDSIKYLYFSRYLMLRYIVVIFLFTNLFWLLILIQYQTWFGVVIAGIMTLIATAAAIEQLAKLHNRKSAVPITQAFLWLQLVVNLLLAGSLFLPIRVDLFPFINTNNICYLILAILFIGVILAYWSIKRIHQIINNRDRYVKVIENFKNN